MYVAFLYKIDFDRKTAERTHAIEIIKGVLKNNAEVVLIAPDFKSNIPEFENSANLTVYKIKHKGYENIISSVIFQWDALKKLWALRKPDIVYVRRSAMMVVNIIYSIIKGVPYVLEENGILEIEYLCYNKKQSLRSRAKLGIFELIEKINIKNSSAIIAVTDQIKEYLKLKYRFKGTVKVINNGANTELMIPLDKGNYRKKLGMDDTAVIAGYVGNLIAWQGVEHIISAMKELKGKGLKLFLYIVGNGIEYDNLIKQAHSLGLNDIVIFTGALENREIPVYIGAMDFVLVPKNRLKTDMFGFGEYEYSPLKLYEYMACGRPIVTSNVKGLDIVSDAGCGVLCEPNDPSSIAEAIAKMVDNKDKWDLMGNNGRRYVCEHHSWDTIAKQTYELLEDYCKTN